MNQQLLDWNEFEKKYSGSSKEPKYYSHLKESELIFSNQEQKSDVVPLHHFFKHDEYVVFLKHPRHVNFSAHQHSFIELNYVYSGTCKQIINGNKIILKEGDLCLLDKNVKHEIASASENDIIINILIRTSYFDAALLQRLSGNDLLTDFFVHAIYEQKRDSRYIIFSHGENNRLKDLIIQAYIEYSNQEICSNEAINSYILLIFTELLRMYHRSPQSVKKPQSKKIVIAEILAYMEENYVSLTLEKTAKKFHFHPNHLTRLLKSHVGKTFMNISHQLKIKNACILLANTDLTIEQIANQVGYTNHTFFYKSFKKFHGVTPAVYRKNIRKAKL